MLLTRYCLKNPIAVTLFFACVCFVGLLAVAAMGRSTLPPVSLPVVTIVAPYPGAGAPEIERLIIEPIEDGLSGVPDLSRVSASAQNGLAQIVVQFRFGSNVDVDRNNAQQAVDAARTNMPEDLVPPIASKNDPTQAPMVEEAVSSALLSDAQLSDVLTRQIAPALRATAGVGTVAASGAQTRQFTLRPLPAALDALRATPLDVYRAAQAGNDVFPGGFLRGSTAEAAIGIDAAATSVAGIEDLPVPVPGDSGIRMKDVADVTDGFSDPTEITRVDGAASAIVYVSRAPGEDSLRTIARVRKTFARLAVTFPLIRFEQLRTDAPYTTAAVDGVLQTLGEGIVLTVLVLLAFLHAWRSALIAAIAIPTSLCAALATMWALGFTLNILSLMGLSLTIGILVDDSIVIIEAISRHAAAGKTGEEAALAGRRELGGAAFAITLVDVAVFAPIALMSGVVGEFMREFGLVIVFATAFSLLVSLTITPMLSARWTPDRSFCLNGERHSSVLRTLRQRSGTLPWTFRRGPLLQVIASWHAAINAFNRAESAIAMRYAQHWLPAAWKRRRAIAIASILTCLASCAPLWLNAIPTEFSPPVNRGEAIVDLTMPAGTPLTATDAAALKITDALLRDSAIAHVEATSGRAFNGTSDVFATNVAQLAIVLADPAANTAVITQEAKSFHALAPQASIEGAGIGMGGAAPISYSIGGSPSTIDAAAARIIGVLRDNPYATDIRSSDLGLAPYLAIKVDSSKARLLDVSPDDAARTARLATAGAIATKARASSGLVDVVVRSDAAQHGSLDQIDRQTIRSGDGNLVTLGDVGRIEVSREPVIIERENGQRIVTVSANPVPGVPMSFVTSSLSRSLRDPGFLPAGAAISPRGDVEQFLDTLTKIGAVLSISLGLVYAILAILYRSYTLPLIIMLTVPLASIGAFGSLFAINALRNLWPSASILQFQTLNLYSMLGIAMLVGLVAKNGILLVEYAERYVHAGRPAFEAAVEAAQLRFRPIVMTTFAMIAGMVPLALGHAIGAEYRRALGTVVIGGLTTSLFLTLFIVPIVYTAYRRRADAARPGKRCGVLLVTEANCR